MPTHLIFLLFWLSAALSSQSKNLDLGDLYTAFIQAPGIDPTTNNTTEKITDRRNVVVRSWNLTFLEEDPPEIPAGPPPELHVAHCFAGQLRSLYLRSVYTSYKESVVDSLEAPSKLFFVASGPEQNPGRYRQAFTYLDPFAVVYVSKEQIISSNLKSPSFPNQYQITKYAICFELVRRYETLLGSLFSHVIITRPDVLMRPVGPAREWRNGMFMAPPTEYTHGFRKVRGYNYANHTLPVSTVLAELLGDADFPGSQWFPRRLTEIFNIVPRMVSHKFFAFLSKPTLPLHFKKDGTGDRIW
eukprot:CAMPEP_0174899866 /NCGR_PEP_ID=MMETSP0167-20121228/28970_1 /TAXON_ID=38298 /ORGANISM="Rhodella maculata, Strain CCMP736" /LENGTH=300 /DNA_ID=CAMNT_0016141021 /DNA_START=43 /DNA_END=942 /DNA_ORIENTATION=+